MSRWLIAHGSGTPCIMRRVFEQALGPFQAETSWDFGFGIWPGIHMGLLAHRNRHG